MGHSESGDQRSDSCICRRAGGTGLAGDSSSAVQFPEPGSSWIWGQLADAGFGNVDSVDRTQSGVFRRNCSGGSSRNMFWEKGDTVGSFFSCRISGKGIRMKKRGRFVLESAVLVPFICLLLVYMVHFTFYVHDCAVCAHAMLETGVKGAWRDGRSDSRIEKELTEELRKKLEERLLWMKESEIKVQMDPVKLTLCISGRGGILPVDGIRITKNIYRVHPCETIRRGRWIKDSLRTNGG